MGFDWEPDLARATTSPPELYVDAAVLELARRRVFARSWQAVARADQLAEVGCFVASEVAGWPIVVTRAADGLRGFHNVCRHRAGPVAVGCGRRRSLQCRYHGWTYGLDGALLAAPEMEGAEGFRGDEVRLAPVEVAAWGPLLFARVDGGGPPLAEILAGVGEPTALPFVMRRDYELACNWKVYVDNYLEGFHIPLVHPELHRELDYDRYRTETARWRSRQHAPLRPIAISAGDGEAAGRAYRPERAGEEAEYHWVFPNLMLNIYQGQFQSNVVSPIDVDHTRVRFEWFAAEPAADLANDEKWSRLLAMSDLVQAQDTAICEAVQRGLRSPACRPGRYSVRRENGVHHFHGLLHEHQSGAD
jgi:choline monooxygenase